MAEKKTAAKGYQKFKADLAAGTLGEVYIFCGEESYLREYYLKEVQKKLVPAGFEEFNFHRVAGKGLTMEELTEMTEAMPMMAERTLIVVTDCDLYKLGEEQRTRLIALLDDFPEYCCLIFVYDLVEYKPNKTYKKLYAALSDKAQEVRFEPQDKSDLINWIARRFRATGHDIDARTAEHLMFTCGSLMTGLVPEIEKIGAYAKGRAVTVEDINAVADPVLDAVVFDMTSAVTKGDYDRASELLGQLLKKQEEPIMILGVISKELRRLYTARLALDSGKDKLWLMDLWNMRSDYPARLLLDAARKTTHEWCANSLALCQKLDRRMKSEKGIDREGELKLLLMQLVIVVEGRYDKNALLQVVDASVLELGGFGIFNDRGKTALLRRLAETRGIILFTDPDGAGFVIRNRLKGAIPTGRVLHAYVPDVYGKEKRKRRAGKEGKLGVEGMPPEVLLSALRAAGATFEGEGATVKENPVTHADLLDLGLIGAGSKAKRAALLRALALPEHLSTAALLDVLGTLTTREELVEECNKIVANRE